MIPQQTIKFLFKALTYRIVSYAIQYFWLLLRSHSPQGNARTTESDRAVRGNPEKSPLSGVGNRHLW
jgi:hypothetical protein